MTLLQQLPILFIAAVLGGTLNAVAGGGSFIGFPALYLSGVLPVEANATNTVALWPGSLASASAYRRELSTIQKGLLFLMIGTSLIGGILGANILLKTSQSTFVHLVPYLLLIATVLFAISGPVTARLRKRSFEKVNLTWPVIIGISVIQLIISTYGGFFGGGLGILILATLSLLGMDNMHVMNGLKAFLNSCVNGVAVIVFIAKGAVVWPQAIVMIIGAIIGGYVGAYYARKVDQKWIRLFVLLVGACMTIFFFVRG
ncbi:sulfite exporter TauE/SafE family protein [Ktedonosporobacter rubrisoli]|uniref:Probable membrane transporter protein n=1 Tax=Ktedonosporobacter rubrisoli TaxID=2509675 RepID=A0A4P6JXV7_KTERU|nr:sulfite exporter TauE/SafE family protein [Ktedonosporobacter rubrisoli]QBD80273.1 sulfite exporter TauE/SafE family protein [Ktedonosporobacter rubrisoli]